MQQYKARYYNDDGYKVLVISSPEFTSSTVRVIMKVGSANDFKGKNGIAFILAKLICINSAGGYSILDEQSSIQDCVYRESTAFWCEAQGVRYVELLEYLLHRIYHTNFNEEMIDSAKHIALMKLFREMDSVDDSVANVIQEQIFARQVIGKPICGKAKTLRNITRDAVIEFYNRYYHTKNSIIVIATADPAERVIQQIRPVLHKYFIHRKDSIFTAFKKYTFHPRRKQLYKNIKQCFVGLAAQAPGFKDYHSVIRMKFLQKLLNNDRELQYKYSVECKLEVYNSVSIICLIFRSIDTNIAWLENVGKQAVRNLKITEADITVALRNIRYRSAMEAYSSNNVASVFGEHFLHLRKIRRDNFDMEIIQTTTVDTVRSMLRSVFVDGAISVFTFGPKLRTMAECVY